MMELLKRSTLFAEERHDGQVDDDGRKYFYAHCTTVLTLISLLSDDEEVRAAAVLHDVLEDTDTSYEELVEEFGKRVAGLVFEVTHEGNDKMGYYFPRLKSRDAILIKFADRLSNLSRMESWDRERRKHYIRNSRFWRIK